MHLKYRCVQGISMKLHRIFVFLAWLSVLSLGAAPAWGANKDMVQLQTQVQQLQEQMTAMQRSEGIMSDDALDSAKARLPGGAWEWYPVTDTSVGQTSDYHSHCTQSRRTPPRS